MRMREKHGDRGAKKRRWPYQLNIAGASTAYISWEILVQCKAFWASGNNPSGHMLQPGIWLCKLPDVFVPAKTCIV